MNEWAQQEDGAGFKWIRRVGKLEGKVWQASDGTAVGRIIRLGRTRPDEHGHVWEGIGGPRHGIEEMMELIDEQLATRKEVAP